MTVTSGSSRTYTVHFLGLISPPMLLFAIPALVAGGARRMAAPTSTSTSMRSRSPGSWGPGCRSRVFSLFLQRTSYLYYMVIVMPGIYLALARAFSRPWMPRWALGGWLALIAAAAVLTYPFLPLPVINL